ncbi:MAG: response regulator [Deltaproteobacteria bacterium]|nr:response regulator [Deltaproteobacteria bacterium]
MPNILIVDDQPCIRELISEELIYEGYEVERVGDAESARAYIKRSRPDLVLLDLYLDGPDGWDVLRDIKRQDPHLPVLIVTAYDSFQDDPRLSRADGYVIKSTDFWELKHQITNALRQKQEPQGRVEAKKGFFPEVGVAQLL